MHAIFRYGWALYIGNRSSDLAEKPSTKDFRLICKQNTQFFTSEKLIDLMVIFFFIQISVYEFV